jgi:hypothetical protein
MPLYSAASPLPINRKIFRHKASASFSPSTLSGLSVWLKADAGVTLDGSIVTAWADQSGNGNNASPANDPIYIPSLINNKPSIDFFTNTSYFNLNSNIDPIKTIICVYKTNTTPTNYQAIVESDMGLYSAIAGDQFGTYLQAEIGYETLAANTSYILIVESDDGVNSNGYVNNVAYSDFAGEGYASRGYVQIGAGQDGGQPCNGYISEVIIYSRVLTTQERQQVQDYLLGKYAIAPTPSGIPVASTASVVIGNAGTGNNGTYIKKVPQQEILGPNPNLYVNISGACYVYSTAYESRILVSPNAQIWDGLDPDNNTAQFGTPLGLWRLAYSAGDGEGGILFDTIATNPSTNSSAIPVTGWSPAITITNS